MKDNDYEKPYRIAHIIRKIKDGGIESVVYNYYHAIDRSQIQFDIYYHADSADDPPEDMIAMGARFYAIPPYNKDLCGYIRQLRKYFSRNHYAVVHSHMNTINVFGLYAAWREGIPFRISHSHSVPGGKELRNFLKYLLRPFATIFATDYFACSEKAGRWLFGNRNYDKGRVRLIANAIEVDAYQSGFQDNSLLRKSMGLDGKVVIGHVGRFTYAKNHKFLLRLFKELKKKYTEAILLLIGDGELRQEIETEIDSLGLHGSVILTGWICSPAEYYHLMNVFVFPSYYEGFSMTVLEAQFCGVPCVVSEAIPAEAMVSGAVKIVPLHESCEKWISAISEALHEKVVLNEKSRQYDIRENAASLCNIYQSKIERL